MAGPEAKTTPFDSPKLRLDKWLWQARFFKARALAAQMIGQGHLRVNGQRCTKPGHAVAVGDVLTFPQAHRIRVVRILDLGERRGPAPEAQALFGDLDALTRPTDASSVD